MRVRQVFLSHPGTAEPHGLSLVGWHPDWFTTLPGFVESMVLPAGISLAAPKGQLDWIRRSITSQCPALLQHPGSNADLVACMSYLKRAGYIAGNINSMGFIAYRDIVPLLEGTTQLCPLLDFWGGKAEILDCLGLSPGLPPLPAQPLPAGVADLEAVLDGIMGGDAASDRGSSEEDHSAVAAGMDGAEPLPPPPPSSSHFTLISMEQPPLPLFLFPDPKSDWWDVAMSRLLFQLMPSSLEDLNSIHAIELYRAGGQSYDMKDAKMLWVSSQWKSLMELQAMALNPNNNGALQDSTIKGYLKSLLQFLSFVDRGKLLPPACNGVIRLELLVAGDLIYQFLVWKMKTGVKWVTLKNTASTLKELLTRISKFRNLPSHVPLIADLIDGIGSLVRQSNRNARSVKAAADVVAEAVSPYETFQLHPIPHQWGILEYAGACYWLDNWVSAELPLIKLISMQLWENTSSAASLRASAHLYQMLGAMLQLGTESSPVRPQMVFSVAMPHTEDLCLHPGCTLPNCQGNRIIRASSHPTDVNSSPIYTFVWIHTKTANKSAKHLRVEEFLPVLPGEAARRSQLWEVLHLWLSFGHTRYIASLPQARGLGPNGTIWPVLPARVVAGGTAFFTQVSYTEAWKSGHILPHRWVGLH